MYVSAQQIKITLDLFSVILNCLCSEIVIVFFKAVPVKPSVVTCGWLIVTLLWALAALGETFLATFRDLETAFHSVLYLHVVVATPCR